MFESEAKDSDILKEISKGIKLKHVRTNDRSKPNLKGKKAGLPLLPFFADSMQFHTGFRTVILKFDELPKNG